MGVRRLAALIGHLPPESSYLRATDQHWTEALELSAAHAELLHAVLVGLARLGGSKRRVRPLRVPRPGDPVKREGVRVSLAELMGEEVADGEAG